MRKPGSDARPAPGPERGFEIRAPRSDDAEAVTAILNATAVRETGEPDTTLTEVQASWSRPLGENEWAQAWVVEHGGRIVGYLSFEGGPPWTSLRIDGYVDPQFEGRGVGSLLLDIGEGRAARAAASAPPGTAVTLYHGVYAGAPGAALLESRGYRLARVFHRMVVDLDARPPAPPSPEGVAIRAVAGEDEAAALHRAIEEAFADHWAHTEVPLEPWLRERGQAAGHDPRLWLVALEAGEVAGGLVGEAPAPGDEEGGWVRDLGVRRRWRRRGVALALLHHAFDAFAARGLSRAALTVDAASETGATRVYGRAGMRVHRAIHVFAREIRPGGAASV